MRLDQRHVIGAAGGIAATIAMTIAMDAAFRRLPPRQRYSLPPREITERVADRAGLGGALSESDLQTATLLSHFAFGAGAGALYAVFARDRAGPLSATIYGVGVWSVSYLGWVPAFKILRPAWRHPPQRNALMIAAHVVWGATLGLLVRSLARCLAPVQGQRTGSGPRMGHGTSLSYPDHAGERRRSRPRRRRRRAATISPPRS